MATFEQKKKRERRLLLILGGIVVLSMLVLVIGLSGGEKAPPKLDILQDATQQAIKEVMQDVAIPRDFFEKHLLDNFNSYTPTGLPQEHGRENPFAPTK